MLSREQILEAQDRKQVEMEVPEWGGRIVIRELTGAERGDFEKRIAGAAKVGMLAQHYRALVVIASVCGEDGKRLFSFDDIDAVSAKAGKVLDLVAAKADELNKLSDAEIEALAKN
jgi:hypothetical protein